MRKCQQWAIHRCWLLAWGMLLWVAAVHLRFMQVDHLKEACKVQLPCSSGSAAQCMVP
jgi:hypothetical protein